MSNKRGLSDVVTVGLIILLAIAAVVIVWSFVRPAIVGVGEKISVDCLTVQLEPVGCTAGTGVVNVRNGPGDTTVNEVRLVYYDASGQSEVESSTCSIAPLVTTACSPPAGQPTLTEAEVSVAAVINGEVCPESDTRFVCT